MHAQLKLCDQNYMMLHCNVNFAFQTTDQTPNFRHVLV